MTAPKMTRCRSCSAPIVFAKLVGDRRGKANPIDADPADNGNLRVFDDGRYTVIDARSLDGYRRAGIPLYLSHFVTCPNAAKHRVPRAVHVDERLP